MPPSRAILSALIGTAMSAAIAAAQADELSDMAVPILPVPQFIRAGACSADGRDCQPLVINDSGLLTAAPPPETAAQLDRIEAMLCAFAPPPLPTCTIGPGETSCVAGPYTRDWRHDLDPAAFARCRR